MNSIGPITKIFLECACEVPGTEIPENHDCIKKHPAAQRTAYYRKDTDDLYIPICLTPISRQKAEEGHIIRIVVEDGTYLSLKALSGIAPKTFLRVVRETFLPHNDPELQERVTNTTEGNGGMKTITSYLVPKTKKRNDLLMAALEAIDSFSDADRSVILKCLVSGLSDKNLQNFLEDFAISSPRTLN